MKKQQKQIRNIGIIAHVDAGKTTVSERILYYTGKIHNTGEVHDGGSRMDRGKQEIAHGITISSAATTVGWRDHQVNLIDTPGHVDFGIEVKRSLRVLDGAVVVFDAVAGVEPQTETNWRMADEFGVVRIAFVNKMDRPGADFGRVVGMMKDRLGVRAVPVQWPVCCEDNNELSGIIDLIAMEYITWTDEVGKKLKFSPVPDEWIETARKERNELIDIIMENDDVLLDLYLETGRLPSEEQIRLRLREMTISGEVIPVLCGTALKNRGIQPLLDAVVDYLPAPLDRDKPVPVADESLLAYSFKTIHQGRFGSQNWMRIYSGSLESGDRIRNTTRDITERVSRIVRMNSDEVEEVDCAVSGDIVAVIGLKHTLTGDTLADPDSDVILETLQVPEPVTRVVIEAANREERERVGMGLNRLTEEDPTLHLSVDAETGQTILSGMGELHLEMAREKLEDELDLEIRFGRPEVAYRETIQGTGEVTYLHKKQDGGPGQFAEVTIRIEPLQTGEGFEFVSRISGGAIPADYIPGVERGIGRAMQSGGLDGHPVVDVRVILLDGKTHPNDSSLLAFEHAGFYAFREAMAAASPVMLEPLMCVRVTTPGESVGDVIGDLNRRRGLVVSQEMRDFSTEVIAEVPLGRLFGYIGDLRSLTSGRASFTMEFDRYTELIS